MTKIKSSLRNRELVMTFEVIWANPQKDIVLQRFIDHFQIEDYFSVVEQSAALLLTVTHPVDLIIMLPDHGDYNLSTFSRVAEVEAKVPANQRMIVVINAPLAVRLLIDASRVLAARATANLYHAATVQTGFDLLKKLREKHNTD